MKISTGTLGFTRSHPLMDAAVPMMGTRVVPFPRPLFYKKDVVLTTIAVDTVSVGGNLYTIVFAGSGSDYLFINTCMYGCNNIHMQLHMSYKDLLRFYCCRRN